MNKVNEDCNEPTAWLALGIESRSDIRRAKERAEQQDGGQPESAEADERYGQFPRTRIKWMPKQNNGPGEKLTRY